VCWAMCWGVFCCPNTDLLLCLYVRYCTILPSVWEGRICVCILVALGVASGPTGKSSINIHERALGI